MSMMSSSAAASASTKIHQHNNIRRLLISDDIEDITSDASMHFNFTVLAILIVAFIIIAYIMDRILRCSYANNPSPTTVSSSTADRRQRLTEMSTGPTLAFSSGLNLAGADHDNICSICLSEFVEGDEIRVLPRCKHGFHVRCIESWLMSAKNTSCPTCRTSCLKTPEGSSSSTTTGVEQQVSITDVEVASTSETVASSSGSSKDEVDLHQISNLKLKEAIT